MTPRDTRDEAIDLLEKAETYLGPTAITDRYVNAGLACVSKARDALALLRAPERGWQDISTYEKKVDSRDSVLIAVQFSEGVFVGEAYWWDAGDRDRFNDTGWWWANTAWGERGESRIDDPVLAWQPMPSPPEDR